MGVVMSKKLNMSLSINPEMQDYIKRVAEEEGVSVSKLICDLIEKYLVNKEKITVIEHNEDSIPVVLKIPVSLKGSEKVKDWLQVRCNAIAQKLGVESCNQGIQQ